MSKPEVLPLRLRRSKTMELMRRFESLPKWQQDMIRDDMQTAFENRIKVMERINDAKRRNG